MFVKYDLRPKVGMTVVNERINKARKKKENKI